MANIIHSSNKAILYIVFLLLKTASFVFGRYTEGKMLKSLISLLFVG